MPLQAFRFLNSFQLLEITKVFIRWRDSPPFNVFQAFRDFQIFMRLQTFCASKLLFFSMAGFPLLNSSKHLQISKLFMRWKDIHSSVSFQPLEISKLLMLFQAFQALQIFFMRLNAISVQPVPSL